MTSDFEFMTYKEAALRLGIAQASVRRQAARNKWPRKNRNDGLVSVGIPVARLTIDSRGDSHADSQNDSHYVHDLQKRIAILEVELAAEQQMKEIAMQDRDAWREQAQKLAGKKRSWWPWQKAG